MNLIRFSSGRVLNADQIVAVQPFPTTEESPAFFDVITTSGFYLPPFEGAEAEELRAFLDFNGTDIVGEWASTKTGDDHFWQNRETLKVLISEVRPGDMWNEIDEETYSSLVLGSLL